MESVFESISAAATDNTLTVGDIVTLQGYFAGTPARHQRIVAASDDGSGVTCVNGYLNIYSNGNVDARWFGLDGTGATNTYTALQRACSYSGASRVILGDSEIYKINQTLQLEPSKIYIGNNITINGNFTTGYIIEANASTGRLPFTLIGNRLTISGLSSNKTGLSGLRIGSSAFSRFEGLVIVSLGGNAIVFAGTGDRDIISFTIDRLETNTGKGIKFKTGTIDQVTYESITDGTISNSFITCTAEGAVCVDMQSEDFTSPATDSSIFGINFDRCSFNSVHTSGGTFIKMAAHEDANIYSINFRNCEGELRYTGTSPTYPCIYLDRVKRSSFDIQGQLALSDGVHLVNYSDNNIFYFLLDGIVSENYQGDFINIDQYSRGNVFNSTSTYMSTISTTDKYTTAPHSTFFLNHVKDQGTFNTFRGTFSSSVIRHLKLDYFSLINSNGKFIDPLLFYSLNLNYTGANWTASDTLALTLPAGSDSGFAFKIPDSISTNDIFAVNMEYRMTGDLGALTSNIRLTINNTNVAMKKSTDWVKQAFFTKRSSDYGYFNYQGTSLPGNIGLEFRKLELITGGIPYGKEIRYTDIENSFYTFPKVVTADVPVNSGARPELVGYNKTTSTIFYK